MADNNNHNGQDSSQHIINMIKAYKWRIIDSLPFTHSNFIPNFRILEDNFNHCLMFNRYWHWVY